MRCVTTWKQPVLDEKTLEIVEKKKLYTMGKWFLYNLVKVGGQDI